METSIESVSTKVDHLHEDVNEIKIVLRDSVKEFSTAITKLVAIEERQIHTNSTVARALQELDKTNDNIDKLSERVAQLEKEQPMTATVVNWVKGAVVALVTILLSMVARRLGIMT